MTGKSEYVANLMEENKLLRNKLEKLENRDNCRSTDLLVNNDEKFFRLFDEMNAASAFHRMVFDESGKPVDYIFVRVNRMFEELTGLKAENIIGRSALDVIPETEEIWIEKYGDVVRTGQPVEFENYSRQLGRYFSVRAYRPVEGHFVVTFINITSQKEAEIKISQTKTFYEKILESTHDGILVTNAEDNIVYVNSAFSENTGVVKKIFWELIY